MVLLFQVILILLNIMYYINYIKQANKMHIILHLRIPDYLYRFMMRLNESHHKPVI